MQRRLRASGWVTFAVAMTGLGAVGSGCGGRQHDSPRVQDDAAASGSSAGSGSTGTGSAGSGSTGTGSTQAAAGSNSGAPSGSVAAAPASRCSLDAYTGGGSWWPTGSAMSISSRIHQFLDDSSVFPSGPVPSRLTAGWACEQAMSILDGHIANGTEAPGLVRFLTTWLRVPVPDAGLAAAFTWGLKLLDPNATLTTLLAGPTGDPHRIGILTDPQVLAARPSISERGGWMQENLLCHSIPLPPPTSQHFQPAVPAMPGLTRREQLQSALTTAPACIPCHQLMDPPGFSLEHFDAMGNYRDLDNGKPVDSSGTLFPMDRPMLTFTSIDDLAPQLAVSRMVAQCFVQAVMSDAYGTSPSSTNLPFTPEEADLVAGAFANSNFSIRELVKAIVETPSFLR
jgi:hypothetical protein